MKYSRAAACPVQIAPRSITAPSKKALSSSFKRRKGFVFPWYHSYSSRSPPAGCTHCFCNGKARFCLLPQKYAGIRLQPPSRPNPFCIWHDDRARQNLSFLRFGRRTPRRVRKPPLRNHEKNTAHTFFKSPYCLAPAGSSLKSIRFLLLLFSVSSIYVVIIRRMLK